MLLRGAPARGSARRAAELTRERRFGLDGAVVPGLLLLVARDLARYDPTRILAWRLSHDERLQAATAWLGPILPAPSDALDRDPIALALAALGVLLALAYATLAAAGAGARARGAVIALAALALVVAPSAGFVAMGVATERPYGQDGGVVQLPLATSRILAGESPYGADYSGTMLARQARVSSFWDELGGNPILRHHAYLPGTHLVMLPFQLASRAAFGFFDPRTVTLLFYALVVALAARIPKGDEARLTAAAAAALNPLVYWHQIFGANDLVFVAMLLAAVLAARASRLALAGALVGLACATKQLAWPFAPFLLLALSGARSFAELLTPLPWRRLLAPLAAAGAVFVLVVVPVASLDWRAFWGDIVVYNVGLPGGDNYPIGGTPGIGAANLLIYFGRVAHLREYFPFSIFYLLLVPLGLLLVRAQLKDGHAEWALATGSTALVASIFFSRVAHPNYLIPAAVCLPLAVLARRRGADIALAPLLLLALAVEVAENAVFAAAWDQALAAGFPERASGLAATLVPRAHAGLTKDPLGLLVSATAAGLGLAYLVLATAGASRRIRFVVPALAVLLLVVGPTLLLSRLGASTGVVRAQDPAVVQADADASRLVEGRSLYTQPTDTLPRGRQAFSESFRLDPPAEILPTRPLLPPGPALLAAVARPLGVRDLRGVSLVALGALAAFLALRFDGRERRIGLAVALLMAPLAIGTVLGAPGALSLAALVGAWVSRERGAPGIAGVLAGVAIALDHRALLAAPFLAAPRGPRKDLLRAAGAAAVSYGLLVLPIALLDVPAFVGRASARALAGPGLGLVNLLAWRGAEDLAAALAPMLTLAALGALGWLFLRPWSRLASAGIASLVGIVLAPSLSADAVAAPILLLGLASLVPGGVDGRDVTDNGP
ncbi:MAG TPA: glycosyltransferase 87 family protein [Vicinamibacteria bacterium]